MMREKLRSKKGVSIAEMLMALVLLGFLILMLGAGLGTAVKAYRSVKGCSESGVLANSLLNVMTEELRYGANQEVSEDGLSVTYDSAVYGAKAKLELETESGQPGGKIKITYTSGSEQSVYPYGEKTYTNLYMCPLDADTPVFDLEDGVLRLNYGICDREGDEKARIENLAVRILNED